MQKKETSANADRPVKLRSRFKYDIRAFLQFADELLLNNHTAQARDFLGRVTKELKIATSYWFKFPEASELLVILKEADKALLAKKHVVAHSAMRLAITELTNE